MGYMLPCLLKNICSYWKPQKKVFILVFRPLRPSSLGKRQKFRCFFGGPATEALTPSPLELSVHFSLKMAENGF